MAMIDYGAVLKKNGKIVNRDEFFMDMETAVGWTDYQKIRYSDCNYIIGGYSDCGNCPRANYIHFSDFELGEWDSFVSDCRSNKLSSNHISGNYFAYAGDTDFVAGFYKQCVLLWHKGEQKAYWLNWDFSKKFSIHLEVGGIKLHFKSITEHKNAYYGRFYYKGDLYEVVFGYGIDPTQSTWNRVKKNYCDKKTIRFVDKFWEEK